MPRSVSLAAYMALAGRARRPRRGEAQARPRGPLIWLHCPPAARQVALMQLVHRLHQSWADATVLMTHDPAGGGEGPRDDPADGPAAGDIVPPRPDRDGLENMEILHRSAPPEETRAVRAFLDHWQPDLCLWAHGNLRPALLTLTGKRGIPALLVEAEAAGFDDARLRWLPDMSRSVLDNFAAIFAVSGNARRRLERLGAQPGRITVTGPLQDAGPALSGDAELRDQLAADLEGRPLWLAAQVAQEELSVVLEAHRRASRLAHRLLLVLVPDDPAQGTAIAAMLRDGGWRAEQWSDGAMPTDETQILLADTAGEMGLWYRLCPVTFMAGSLHRGMSGLDPFAPAALGSAVIYGPHIPAHMEAYSRLVRAGAAALIRDAEGLANAVIRLSAPDAAAEMASAGWEVVTQGAEVTDAVMDWIAATIDERQAG
ncbi:3-deoxy-D-manno-octulosonic acid transferase [Pseudooceanicola aestuarii]|uniref:3-deoxy-D-manno-octulosonic acid transferase n=1 Tax=Pseudooceanicola aestuarii TaxID=2697319 RepID=UPI0019539F52|nr:glycosyltransferase N-terminal domain-containing protein [Pseudooceanicola aestuarii]